MGFNYTLKTINKKKYKKISNMNKKKLTEYIKKNIDIEYYDIDLSNDELHSAIRYIGDETISLVAINKDTFTNEDKKKFFYHNELKNLAEDYGNSLFVINKKSFEKIIEEARIYVYERYNNLIDNYKNAKTKDEKEYAIDDIILNLETKRMDWDKRSEYSSCPYSLNREKIMIDSQSLEYDIFNLVTFHRNFDFENNILFIEGS